MEFKSYQFCTHEGLDGGVNVNLDTVNFPLESLKRKKISYVCSYLCLDLKTMSERLKSRYYTTRKLFMADMQRIFTNCREYNPPESEYYKCANLLEKFFYTKIKEAGLIDK